MTPRPFAFPAAVPHLANDAVTLRDISEADIPAWFLRASDPESAALAGDPIPDSIARGEQWLQRHRERFRQQAALRWAIVPNGSAGSVGTVGLSFPSREASTGKIGTVEIGIAEIGIVIGRAHWNTGIGTAAVRLVLRYAFNTLGLAEIQAEVLERNLASRRLFEKLGFHLQRIIVGDPHSDTHPETCHLLVLGREDSAAA